MEYEVFEPEMYDENDEYDEYYDQELSSAWSKMWNGGYYDSEVFEPAVSYPYDY